VVVDAGGTSAPVYLALNATTQGYVKVFDFNDKKRSPTLADLLHRRQVDERAELQRRQPPHSPGRTRRGLREPRRWAG
jgi:hypothetical protein